MTTLLLIIVPLAFFAYKYFKINFNFSSFWETILPFIQARNRRRDVAEGSDKEGNLYG